MHVVATAGHVDHGKSTLVRALTGQDPDRRAGGAPARAVDRLGYCWTDLDPVGDVAFVDVPGHERFLSTTLAGLGPVPVAMLVVAADDPWMPQAAEHLAALDALGVRHGVLAVTRSDLADPAPGPRSGARRLSRTSLARAPEVVVSGRTGEGLDDLRSALGTVLAAMVVPDRACDVRLWVDRAFHVRGVGTVVHGHAPGRDAPVGDVLVLGADDVRVRALECLGEPVDRVSGPARVAVRLGGRGPDRLGRGSVLVTPDAFAEVAEVDVRLSRDGPPPERPLLHVGSTRQSVHARPLGTSDARLRLEKALPLRHGDRLVLRDPGSRTLWGAEVLDAAPPPLTRRGAAQERPTSWAVEVRVSSPSSTLVGWYVGARCGGSAYPTSHYRTERSPSAAGWSPPRRPRHGRGASSAPSARPTTVCPPPRPCATSVSPTPTCSRRWSSTPYAGELVASSSRPTCRRRSVRR